MVVTKAMRSRYSSISGFSFALWENLFLVNQKSFNRRISFFKIKFIKRRKKHEHKRNDERTDQNQNTGKNNGADCNAFCDCGSINAV